MPLVGVLWRDPSVNSTEGGTGRAAAVISPASAEETPAAYGPVPPRGKSPRARPGPSILLHLMAVISPASAEETHARRHS